MLLENLLDSMAVLMASVSDFNCIWTTQKDEDTDVLASSERRKKIYFQACISSRRVLTQYTECYFILMAHGELPKIDDYYRDTYGGYKCQSLRCEAGTAKLNNTEQLNQAWRITAELKPRISTPYLWYICSASYA